MKKFSQLKENYDLANYPSLWLVKNNDELIDSIKLCLIEGEGYEEIEIDEIEIADHMGESVGNPCRVDGSRINLHLIRMEVYDAVGW